MFDFLIGRKYGQKGRQVELVFRELKAQIYWPTTDQKVRGSNPCGRTSRFELKITKSLVLLSQPIIEKLLKFGKITKYFVINIYLVNIIFLENNSIQQEIVDNSP